MILTFLLSLLSSFLTFLISFLPNGVALPAVLLSSLSYIVNILHAFESFFPVQTLLIVVGTFALVESGGFVFKIIKFVMNSIWANV